MNITYSKTILKTYTHIYIFYKAVSQSSIAS